MKRPSTNKPHVMTLVVRGDKSRLTAMRKQLHIAAIQKDTTLSALLISILMNYISDSLSDGPVEARS
jgi:hypothetical protein